MPTKIVAAILAAGSSSRFGSPKQLAKIGNKSLIDLALDALENAGLDRTVVVLGCNFKVINDHLNERKNSTGTSFNILQNPDWKQGISSSVHVATKFAIAESATHLLLLSCDQPFVDATLVQTLANFAKENSKPPGSNDLANTTQNSIVACKYESSAGIPAIFPAIHFGELMKITGDKGAKSVILRSAQPILVDFPNGAQDIDYPADLDGITLTDQTMCSESI